MTTMNNVLKSGRSSTGSFFLHQYNMRHYTTNEEKQNTADTLQEPLVNNNNNIINEVSQQVDNTTTTTTTQTLIDTLNQTTSNEALAAAATAQIGDFKAMGLCNFTPVGGLEAMLEYVHVIGGLPWWGSIALATVLVRTALLPLIIKLQRNNARLMNINPEVTRIMNNLKTAQAEGDAVAIGKYTNEIRDLFTKNECHPTKSLGLPLIQMPVMISFFMALRAMAELPVPGLTDGGMGWFTDLSAKDPYYVLPAVSALGMLAVLEAGTEAGAATPQTKGMKNFMRGVTILMVPFTAWMPSGVFVYWITSNIYSLAQVMALKNPSIRKSLNIPPLVKPAKELQKDSKGFMENFKDQQKLYEKKEKDRVLRERQQAAAMARRASKRRF
ncbi:60Kd inner membrane protein-domain-containing protein [Cunninghamella echinulata]|nr:60Kd inner membrane protein-domain-containing protein [Cunninghamella echinulata]